MKIEIVQLFCLVLLVRSSVFLAAWNTLRSEE